MGVSFAESSPQVYSHGQSEIILGNAIKKLNLPRDELVILTKVRIYASLSAPPACLPSLSLSRAPQVYFPVAKEGYRLEGNPEDSGIINQHGLNRKVRSLWPAPRTTVADHDRRIAAYLRLGEGEPEALAARLY